MLMLLVGVLVALPVEQAEADSLELGPDGYFSMLEAFPMRKSGATADGARKVLFGKEGNNIQNAAKEVESGDDAEVQVDGKYLVLGKGPNESKNRRPRIPGEASWGTSSTTALAGNEVLLWADDVVTSPFVFAAGKSCSNFPCNTFDAGTADSDKKATYESYVAKVSRLLGSDLKYLQYSDFELVQIGAASQLTGVCTKGTAAGCNSGYDAAAPNGQTSSVGSYRVFPLSQGDMGEYFNTEDGYFTVDNLKRRCSSASCNNGSGGTWSRSARWDLAHAVGRVLSGGQPDNNDTLVNGLGLRPAFRLNLSNLLLSAHSGNQSQVLNEPDGASPDSLRLTFVDAETSVVLTGSPTIEQESGVGGEWVLKDLQGSSNLTDAEGHNVQSGLGWKLVDPADVSGGVLASGRTNYDAAADSAGNMVVPCEALTPDKAYILSVWGQEDGSDTVGWSNRATKPVTGTVTADGDGVCALDIKTSPSFGISLTGQTSGTLTAYRIGEYDETLFTQTGALKSVRLTTPEGLGLVLKDVVVAAGGGDVDADNPIGWVASRWLGYPTDPLSDDVTSAFSPYAGQLQLFAQELAKHTDALGAVAGSLEAGTFPQPESMATLQVNSGPGLYLIVDSTQSSGGSLPIVVGTKVFNEALEDVVEDGMVDFVDAGVKGKPRLGQAALKTSVTDVSKRVVNDAGLDGFDVGGSVEFEIALRVPDLSGLSGVTYDAYAFKVEDTAAPGLTLPQAADVRVLVDVPSPDTDVTNTSGLSIGVSGDTLSVNGLKAVFAEDAGGHVANKATIPAGSLMRIRYAAVLNAGASFSAPGGGGLDPNVNTATLTRSYTGSVTAGWTDNSDDTESRSATANAYTFKLDLVKVDKDDTSRPLGGAKFQVSRDGRALRFTQVSAGVYRLDAAGGTEVTTHADGTLSLLGVAARELSFRETQAPDGYFTVSDFTVEVVPVWDADASEVTVVSYRTGGTNLAYVSQDGRSVTVADPSKSLTNLPYTGGVGILLLLIIGGVFLMFAVRPYYLSHRAEATANILI
jgi:fimbrial isopeptide formation D2 family protein